MRTRRGAWVGVDAAKASVAGSPSAAMRLALVTAVVTMVVAPVARSNIVDGNITTHTTWDRTGNPWTVTTNVQIKQGAILEIERGVIVEFTGNWQLSVDSTTGGDLVVIGAEYDSVYFRPAAGVSEWKGIKIGGSDASQLNYAAITDAKIGLDLNTSDVPITHCAVRRSQMGVKCVWSSPTITSSWISECQYGIFSEAGSNSGPFSEPVITDCNLFDNSLYNLYMHWYLWTGTTTIEAQYNWWGSNDVSEIQASIYDSLDDEGCNATVNYANWLAQTPVEHRTWGAT